MRKILIKLLDSLFLMRPILLIPVWTPFLVGYYRSGSSAKHSVLALLGITFLGGSIYILNQIYDIKSDKINNKLFILPDGHLSIRWAYIEYILLSIFSILLFIKCGLLPALLCIVGIGLGILYSHPKYSYKNKYIHALVLNGVGHGGLIYLIGWATGSTINIWAILRCIPYIIAYGAVYLMTTIPDIEGDRLSGKYTLAVKYGGYKSKMIALGLIVLGSIISIFVKESTIYMVGIFTVPFLILSFKNNAYLFVSIKIAVLLLSLITVVFFPKYLLLLVIVIVGSKFYYKKRFGINYPF